MSSLKFGTSGLRGLALDLDGPPAARYTHAFVTVMAARGNLSVVRPEVLLARDLRPSSAGIMQRCADAIRAAGFRPVDCGEVPTPALALAAMAISAPSIMITGSHIPEDRNGLKFYRPDGEIDKQDEAAIAHAHDAFERGDDHAGRRQANATMDVFGAYKDRYVHFFGAGAFTGLRIGCYQHSSVARDIIPEVLVTLGAEVLRFGHSTAFVPVDTEAIRPEDSALVQAWAAAHRVDAIVSTDGDADRPLIADAEGCFLRGDLVGALTAAHLGIRQIVTPITSNSRIEQCSLFEPVKRTQVGSPHVLSGLAEMAGKSPEPVMGFEANGGVILSSSVLREGRKLHALPTRDALLPICALLAEIQKQKRPLSSIAAELRFATALSTRIEHAPQERSAALLNRLADPAFLQSFFASIGGVKKCNMLDGARFTTASGAIVHYRPSGNAPELRIYVEAQDPSQASALLEWARAAARPHVVG